MFLSYSVIEDGVRKARNTTVIMPTTTCCQGYELRGGMCLQKDPDHPCKDLSCTVEGAECFMVKRCGHKLAVFMKDNEIMEDCHQPGYLDLLSCPGRCQPDPCHPSQCPTLNSTEVVCITNRECSCKATWLRKHDWAEMDCLTGQVKEVCSDVQE